MYQKLTIVGYLGDDPHLRYTPDGTPCCSFSVATSKKWASKDGQQHENTVWFRVTAWRKLGENCEQYLRKGRPVLVEGELREPRAWQGRDGEWRASLEVVALQVKFLPYRDGDGGQATQSLRSGGGGDVEPIAVGEDLGEDEIPF